VISRRYGLTTVETIVANQVVKITLGVDAAKDQHLIYNWQTQQTTRLPNQRSDIKTWLKTLHGPVRLAPLHWVTRSTWSIHGSWRTTAKRSMSVTRPIHWTPGCWPATWSTKRTSYARFSRGIPGRNVCGD